MVGVAGNAHASRSDCSAGRRSTLCRLSQPAAPAHATPAAMPAGTSHGSTASWKSNTRDASTEPTAIAPNDASRPASAPTTMNSAR